MFTSNNKKINEPEFLASPLNTNMLNYKVYITTKKEAFLVQLIGIIIGGVVGLIFYGGLFKEDGEATLATYIANTVIFLAVGFIAKKFIFEAYCNNRLKKRANLLKNQFRDLLSTLTSSLAAGSNIRKAFESAEKDMLSQYGENSFIYNEVQEINNALKSNISIESMLASFADRSGNEDIQNFANIFSICYQKGGDMKTVMQKTYDSISVKMSIADEITTKLTSNKLQHNVMSLMPIAIVLMLKLTNPSLANNFTTPLGIIANTIAIGIFVFAYKFGQKITDIKG